MEIIAKCAAAALFASALSLLIKKSNPELSFAVSAAISALIMLGSAGLLDIAKDLVECARDMLGTSSTLIRPVMKCCGIAFISSFGAKLCQDASQASAASALELVGTLSAAAVAMPLIISMMKMIGTMV